MDNKIKRYLDRVVIELVKDTNIDYDREEISFPFSPSPFSFSHTLLIHILFQLRTLKPYNNTYSLSLSFSKYCENLFGITEEEIDYVWGEYVERLIQKIENGK